jgi:hypothetical protein
MDAITKQIAALDDMFYQLAIEQRDKAWRENDSLRAELALRNAELVELRRLLAEQVTEKK